MRITPADMHRIFRLPASSPFLPGSAQLIVHGCHHKVGTVWFTRVFRAVAARYGLRIHAGPQDALRGQDILFEDHSRIDAGLLPPFRGSHIIRDPRDVVVSGYFYHLRAPEPWLLRPNDEFAGLSYQEYLRGLDMHEGLLAEIERASKRSIADMVRWDYSDPRFIEIRYEELLGDEDNGFRRLFEWYGFTPKAVDNCVKIARRYTLERTRRTGNHIRSGRPGDWRNHFTPEHVAAFKTSTGDAAVLLGYEPDSTW